MTFKTQGYEVVPDAIPIEIVNFLYEYFLRKRDVVRILYDTKYVQTHPTHMIGSWEDEQIPNTYSHYGDIAMDTLLANALPIVETITKMRLIPAYSYARIYKKGDVLVAHVDRPECEISTTLFLGGDEWEIYLEGKAILPKVGEMIIYKGCDLVHWRDAFEGEKCVQVFLHYVPYTKNAKFYDGREMLGLPMEFMK